MILNSIHDFGIHIHTDYYYYYYYYYYYLILSVDIFPRDLRRKNEKN